MIVKTDFGRGPVDDLVAYMKRDNDEKVKLRDHTGRDLDQSEVDAFVERSEAADLQRHVIISPDPDAAYTEAELDRGTRKTLSQWRSGRVAMEYVYAVHADQENPHTHVAMTGQERDLTMDKADLTDFREQAREAFREPERLKARAPERAGTREQSTEPTKQRLQEAEQSTRELLGNGENGRIEDHNQELDRNPSRERDRR